MNFRGTVSGGTIQFKFVAILRNPDLVTGKGPPAYDANALVIERAPFTEMIVNAQNIQSIIRELSVPIHRATMFEQHLVADNRTG